jgi:hypothetical protein
MIDQYQISVWVNYQNYEFINDVIKINDWD